MISMYSIVPIAEYTQELQDMWPYARKILSDTYVILSMELPSPFYKPAPGTENVDTTVQAHLTGGFTGPIVLTHRQILNTLNLVSP